MLKKHFDFLDGCNTEKHLKLSEKFQMLFRYFRFSYVVVSMKVIFVTDDRNDKV